MIIYLDTSALIKLYIIEEGSEIIDSIARKNSLPIPVWDLHVIEFHNVLKLKVFRGEIVVKEGLHLSVLFNSRKKEGIYYTPEMDRKEHTDLCLAYTDYSAEYGCRILDIMHVAAASLFGADLFVTCDQRQKALAAKVGLEVKLIQKS